MTKLVGRERRGKVFKVRVKTVLFLRKSEPVMAGFNEDALKKKLDDLNMSQQSIQTVSLWLIHHKKHAHTVVNVWYRELVTGKFS